MYVKDSEMRLVDETYNSKIMTNHLNIDETSLQ